MIAQLTGRIAQREDGRCVIDVNGVGYLLQASTRTLAALAEPPAVVTVQTEMQVREDAITLFGFIDTEERDWFRLLTTVQGVGGRVALNLLSCLAPRDLGAAILAGRQGRAGRAVGVGPKLAVRLATELRDKVAGVAVGAGVVLSGGTPLAGHPVAEAISALTNLGYRRPEAEAAVNRVRDRLGAGAELDAFIREGLKELAR